MGFWSNMSNSWCGQSTFSRTSVNGSLSSGNVGMAGAICDFLPWRLQPLEVGQASNFPGGQDVYRGVKIELPDIETSMTVSPNGSFEWWGGQLNLSNSTMTTVNPVTIPATGPVNLNVNLAYWTETDWDFLWVQVSNDKRPKLANPDER